MNNIIVDEGFFFDEYVVVCIVWFVLYFLMFVIGVMGNLLVCIIVLGVKNKMFCFVKGYFILNLVLFDLMVFFLFFLFDFVYLENCFIWFFGFVFCKFINVLSFVLVIVLGLMLICIGYEWYKVIVYLLMSCLSK